MGMYTELIFGCELKKDTPRVCIEAIDYVINGGNKKPKYENPQTIEEKHFNECYIERTLSDEVINKFIDEYDLYNIFRNWSYYFGACQSARFVLDYIDGAYHISTRANCKDYQGQIEKFLEYIRPWVGHGSGENDIYAYVLYEADENPTIYALHREDDDELF